MNTSFVVCYMLTCCPSDVRQFCTIIDKLNLRKWAATPHEGLSWKMMCGKLWWNVAFWVSLIHACIIVHLVHDMMHYALLQFINKQMLIFSSKKKMILCQIIMACYCHRQYKLFGLWSNQKQWDIDGYWWIARLLNALDRITTQMGSDWLTNNTKKVTPIIQPLFDLKW